MDNEELCYAVVSRICDNELKLHGIFTHEYLQKHGKRLAFERDKLKEKHDKVMTYILPLNHYIEKGMII